MGTLGHQGIFVISIYFFLLILAHFRLPAFQATYGGLQRTSIRIKS